MSVVVRFAPSPTGLLHVGNIRAALFNWLFARRRSGKFILRLDDTDRARSQPKFEAAIERDLTWLGLGWDLKERQSDRLAHYDKARDALIASGRLYPCYETPAELEFKRRRLLGQGRPPVYDRAALKLDEPARRKLEEGGRKPHWRFMLASEEVRWNDLVRGPQHVDAVPSAAARAQRAGERAGNGQAPAVDRAHQGRSAVEGADRLV